MQQRYDDCKEANNMDDEDDAFKLWEKLNQVSVDECAEQNLKTHISYSDYFGSLLTHLAIS